MKCPICKTELVVTGQERLETLMEHVQDPNGEVCLKNKYQCPNKQCEANKDDLVWNEYGEYYSSSFGKKYNFIDNNNGPFGSWERKTQVTICKKDENFTLFEIFGFRVDVEYHYDANEDGDVLKRWWNLKYWIKEKNGFSYINYIPGIHMFWYVIKSIWRIRIVNEENVSWWSKNFLDEIEHRTWDKRWWSLSARWIMKRVCSASYVRAMMTVKAKTQTI